MEKVLEMFRAKSALDASTVVYGTGGGARKYATKIKDLLGVGGAPNHELISVSCSPLLTPAWTALACVLPWLW